MLTCMCVCVCLCVRACLLGCVLVQLYVALCHTRLLTRARFGLCAARQERVEVPAHRRQSAMRTTGVDYRPYQRDGKGILLSKPLSVSLALFAWPLRILARHHRGNTREDKPRSEYSWSRPTSHKGAVACARAHGHVWGRKSDRRHHAIGGREGGRAQRTQYLVPQTACEDQRAWFRACLCSPSGARGRGRRVRLPTTTRWQRGRLRDAP